MMATVLFVLWEETRRALCAGWQVQGEEGIAQGEVRMNRKETHTLTHTHTHWLAFRQHSAPVKIEIPAVLLSPTSLVCGRETSPLFRRLFE